MKKGNMIKTIIVVAVLVLLVAGYYIFRSVQSNKQQKARAAEKAEGVEQLLKQDLEKDYPLTPTSVIAYYSDLILAYYDEDCSEEMREKLVIQSRLMYDEELLAINQEETQLLSLEADVREYKKEKKQIISYTVCELEEVAYNEADGHKVAVVSASYRVRAGSKLSDIEEQYLLRKDEKDCWKILGWQLVKE